MKEEDTWDCFYCPGCANINYMPDKLDAECIVHCDNCGMEIRITVISEKERNPEWTETWAEVKFHF